MITRSDPKEFLFLNRDEAGKRAGRAFVERLKERTLDRDKAISNASFRRPLKAIQRHGRSTPSDLSVITGPTSQPSTMVVVLTSEYDSSSSSDSSRPTPDDLTPPKGSPQ